MQRRNFVTFLGAVVALPSLAAARRVNLITVLDAEFRSVSEISSDLDLAAFNKHWATRIQSTDVAMRLTYKIDIQYGRLSDRWLYDPAGYTQVLSKKDTPGYRLESPSAFNALLGITE